MSSFFIPVSFAEELQGMLNLFWCVGNEGKGVKWLSWKKLSMRKEDWGIGFLVISCFQSCIAC